MADRTTGELTLTTAATIDLTNDRFVAWDSDGSAGDKTKAIIPSQLVSLIESNITTFQPLDSDLTSIAALTTTTFGRGLLTQSDAAALRTTAGLVIGTDVQAFDPDLASIAALTTTSFGRSFLTQADAASSRTYIGAQADLATIAAAVTINDQTFSRYSISINSQSGTTYTLLSSDNGRQVTVTNSNPITLTVPSGLPSGFNCLIVQGGAGVITIAAGASVTINQRQSFFKTAGQHAVCSLLPTSTSNTYRLAGDLAA